jgi:hypothetical protein
MLKNVILVISIVLNLFVLAFVFGYFFTDSLVFPVSHLSMNRMCVDDNPALVEGCDQLNRAFQCLADEEGWGRK